MLTKKASDLCPKLTTPQMVLSVSTSESNVETVNPRCSKYKYTNLL